MLPVKQADDLPVRVGRPRSGDVALLSVWMPDAEMTVGGVPGNQGRRDERITIQILDVFRQRLILVLVASLLLHRNGKSG